MGPQEYTCGQAVVRDTPRLYNRGHRTPSALSPSDPVVQVAQGIYKKRKQNKLIPDQFLRAPSFANAERQHHIQGKKKVSGQQFY